MKDLSTINHPWYYRWRGRACEARVARSSRRVSLNRCRRPAYQKRCMSAELRARKSGVCGLTSNTRSKCFDSFSMTRLYGRCCVNFLCGLGIISASTADRGETGRTCAAGRSASAGRPAPSRARSRSARPRSARGGWSTLCRTFRGRGSVRITQTYSSGESESELPRERSRTYVMWDWKHADSGQ